MELVGVAVYSPLPARPSMGSYHSEPFSRTLCWHRGVRRISSRIWKVSQILWQTFNGFVITLEGRSGDSLNKGAAFNNSTLKSRLRGRVDDTAAWVKVTEKVDPRSEKCLKALALTLLDHLTRHALEEPSVEVTTNVVASS